MLVSMIYDKIRLRKGQSVQNIISRNGVIILAQTGMDKEKLYKSGENHLLRMLDRGIDDMEAGREIPLEEAFQKINELRSIRRDARV